MSLEVRPDPLITVDDGDADVRVQKAFHKDFRFAELGST
jgi:hypothetical protein